MAPALAALSGSLAWQAKEAPRQYGGVVSPTQ
jgi:hypothetical protein